MGKKSKSQSKSGAAKEEVAAPISFLSGSAAGAVDSSLSLLFEQSAGPVKAPNLKAKYEDASLNGNAARVEEKRSKNDKQRRKPTDIRASEENNNSDDASIDDDEAMVDVESQGEGMEEEISEDEDETSAINAREQSRKRKRANENYGLEASYMQRIAREEAKEHKKELEEKSKRRKVKDVSMEDANEEGIEDSEAESRKSPEQSGEVTSDDDDNNVSVLHESATNTTETDAVEKASRTVFLGNVSSEAIKSKGAKKTLMSHLNSILSSLPESSPPHTIESIRFRSTAFSSGAVPKRAAYAKREIMDSTTKSTNAYAVYSTVAAARRALQLNGTIVLDRHLRVDSVARPASTDYKRCVFVGNLGFVDQEADDPEADEKQKQKKRNTPQADLEEGLWRTFNDNTGTAGGVRPVESVRVVRDRLTRVGKGFAYVQFRDENAVEAALLLDGKKFPPLLPRKLRVTRAKRMSNDRVNTSSFGITDNTFKNPNKSRLGASKFGISQDASIASEQLVGRATAAKLRGPGEGRGQPGSSSGTPLVFEGHRATGSAGLGFKLKPKPKGKGGKPKTRSTRRAKAFRASGKK